MEGITVSMAIVDFIPVILFFIGAIILQRDLYNKLVKGAYALMAAGAVMVFVGGFFKALWKILVATAGIDIRQLDLSFFPFSAVGFVLYFLGISALLYKKGAPPAAAAPALAVTTLESYNMPFIVLQVLGNIGYLVVLMVAGKRMKKGFAVLLFAVSMVAMLGMGYLSSAFDDSSGMNWLAQCVNIVAQGAGLWGILVLHRAGLAAPDALKKTIRVA